MKFRTPVPIRPFEQPIDHHRPGLLLGSCFAEEIGSRMRRAKLPVTVNPFGIQFNPASIAASIRRLHSGKSFTLEELIPSEERWVSLAHHGSFSGEDPRQTLEGINRAFEAGCRALEEARYLILTLGTAWVFEYRPTGEVATNCHKLPPTDFVRRRLSPEAIAGHLGKALAPYPDKQVILTVSPVRHPGSDPVEDRLSKSTLVVAAAALCEQRPQTLYFPAYEIVEDELRDYRFYAPDMRHPSDVAVEYIWEHFAATAFSVETRSLIARIERLAQAAEHHPLNPESDAHAVFRRQMAEEAGSLQGAYPELDFSAEIETFAAQCR